MNDLTESCIKACNSLLRGELSAVETYAQAIRKYSDLPISEDLRTIRTEHVNSAQILSSNVREMGGEPENDSGSWGVFAKAVQGAANLFGADSAIESLKRGEESGRNDYESALKSDDVMESCKDMIRDRLLPPIHAHIATLEALERLAKN